MECPRQEYWSGRPFPSPGDLPNPGINPGSPALQADNFTVWVTATAAAKSLQSCPTLCDPIDGSPGILQARTLEWVAISFSNAWKWKVKVKSLSRVRLLATPWTAAHQASPSMGFSRQEYWSGVPLPSPIHFHFPVLYSRNIDYLVDYLFYIQYYAYVTSDFLVYLPSHHCTTPPPYHFW